MVGGASRNIKFKYTNVYLINYGTNKRRIIKKEIKTLL